MSFYKVYIKQKKEIDKLIDDAVNMTAKKFDNKFLSRLFSIKDKK